MGCAMQGEFIFSHDYKKVGVTWEGSPTYSAFIFYISKEQLEFLQTTKSQQTHKCTLIIYIKFWVYCESFAFWVFTASNRSRSAFRIVSNFYDIYIFGDGVKFGYDAEREVKHPKYKILKLILILFNWPR